MESPHVPNLSFKPVGRPISRVNSKETVAHQEKAYAIASRCLRVEAPNVLAGYP